MTNIEGLVGNRLSFIAEKPNINTPPAVILSHGFGVDKNEVGYFFSKLSRCLLDENIFCIRYDFTGWGDSLGNLSETSIRSQLNDLNEIINHFQRLNLIDANNINLCGFSLGAAISALATEKNNIKNIALVSPVGNLLSDFKLVLGDPFFKKLKEFDTDEKIHIPLPWRNDVLLSKKFFNSLSEYDVYKTLNEYAGNIFSIAGENDFSATHVKYFKKNLNKINNHHEIIENQDHTFNAYTELSQIDEIVKKTTDWLVCNINR